MLTFGVDYYLYNGDVSVSLILKRLFQMLS